MYSWIHAHALEKHSYLKDNVNLAPRLQEDPGSDQCRYFFIYNTDPYSFLSDYNMLLYTFYQ